MPKNGTTTMPEWTKGPDANTTQAPQMGTPEPGSLVQTLQKKLNYDELTNCMRCGFCLPACPTFRETGIEAESPRGRIALMKAVADGLMDPDEAFKEQMDHCLGCRACEPACPADVKYGQLIEQARDSIQDHEKHGFLTKTTRNVAFKGMFPHRSRMKVLGLGLKAYEKSGLQFAARKSGALRMIPKQLREMESIMPSATNRGVKEQLGEFYPAEGTAVGKVGMFSGCIMDVMFADTNVKTVKLLSAAGFDVVIPKMQNCCGALHAHSGEMDQARELAKKNVAAFREADVDFIVSNAGGCGALLIEYDHLLKDDPEWKEQAEWFAKRVKDISQLIVDEGRPLEFESKQSETITYQDSCHLRNVMKSGEAPRKLMKQVGNACYVEQKEADRCCGSAGIYNITQPEMANQILEHKMEHVADTKASYLLTSNPGCLLQMKLGVERHKSQLEKPMEAVHLVDFLYERMKKDSPND